jgi:general secretion pathway protein I
MPSRRDYNCPGFTLVEVLVALAIVAVALLAVLRVAGQGAQNSVDLKARLFAGWVAQDRMAEHRAKGDWLPTGKQAGSQRQGGVQFAWREEVVPTPNPAFRRVDIYVYADPSDSHHLAHLTGFVVNPPGGR